MFDSLVVVEATTLLSRDTTSPIDQLHACTRLKRAAEAREAELIATLATSSGWVSDDDHPTYEPVTDRRLLPVGADGTPCVDETIVLEVACAQSVSVGVAGTLLRDTVNLKYRHPLAWQAVQEGRVPFWQARKLADACAAYDLTADQARAVDDRVAPAWGRYSTGRLINLIHASILKVAPDAVRDRTRALTRTREYRTETCTADPCTTYLNATLGTADATFLTATVNRVADILHDQGDTSDRDHRMAKALGILATPAYALSLLGVHTRRGLDPDQAVPTITPKQARQALPVAQVYVHLSDQTLTEGGVARVERLGPILVDQLAHIVGHGRIKLTPVLRINDTDPGVDAYEIPDTIRENVTLRDRYEVFPYSSRDARHQDVDHTIPYTPTGPPGQTRPSNLGCLSRRAHRAKTLGGWTLTQPAPGIFLWHSRLGQTLAIGPWGTLNLNTS